MENTNRIRQTKIVCTLGPASETPEIIEQMIREGMDCARFNFSHGNHAEQLARLTAAKLAASRVKKPVCLMLDTKGPEIRIKQFADKTVTIKAGQKFALCCNEVVGDSDKVSVTYSELYKEVEIGNKILIDDGLMCFTVTEVKDKSIITVADNSGKLSNNKSINLPDTHIMLPSLTESDEADLAFGIENGFDYIAASFIRSAADVQKIRAVLKRLNAEDVLIIAKIENREGVNNIDEIIAEADGIMVGRGDLGVEIPAEEVPAVQKMIIRKCNAAAKPVITATQMLESMNVNPRPTRAEVGDVANAMYDGSDAVMLSGETAAGAYPLEAVKTMNKILLYAEATLAENANYTKPAAAKADITSTIAFAADGAANSLNAKVIVTPTSSGGTARAIACLRPEALQLAVTDVQRVMRQLCLVWGVIPLFINEFENLNSGVRHCLDYALKYGVLNENDIVVVTAGVPLGSPGGTNMIKINYVKDYYEG